MLPKMRNGAWRLRWGVVVLALFVPAAIPASASASGAPAQAAADSIQYINVTINPPTGTQTTTYNNQAQATTQVNGQVPFSFQYALHVTSAPIVTANNNVTAQASDCSRCGAIAIGFQVVLVSKQELAELNADSTAVATSSDCGNCATLAEAYQIIYATNSHSPETRALAGVFERARLELEMLKHSDRDINQVQSESNAIVNGIVSWLERYSDAAPANTVPGWSPAINNSNLPTKLATNTQPVVDLLSAVQH